MNLNHLKYAVEVARTNSITKAAENLYMGQPNLSRAIKELEESLGIAIFKRTSKGLSPTQEGERFLAYAFDAIEKISEIESIYLPMKSKSNQFSASVTRASHISDAFNKFIDRLDTKPCKKIKEVNIDYKETGTLKIINNILNGSYNIGVISYSIKHDKNFMRLLNEKILKHKIICEYKMLVTISENHPLAKKNFMSSISKEDLKLYPQIVYGDPYIPFIQSSEIIKEGESENCECNGKIRIYERSSMFAVLRGKLCPYMWTPPISVSELQRHEIVQREIKDSDKIYKDLLIFGRNYKFSELDNIFMEELQNICDKIKFIK